MGRRARGSGRAARGSVRQPSLLPGHGAQAAVGVQALPWRGSRSRAARPRSRPAQGRSAPPYHAPAPNWWGGCNYDLRGNWRITGTQTQPYRYTYTAAIQVRQYGPWLQITQPEDNISYYGRCTGHSIQLDVYSGGRFIGYEIGTVSVSGPGWEMSMRAVWAEFTPSYIAGHATGQRW